MFPVLGDEAGTEACRVEALRRQRLTAKCIAVDLCGESCRGRDLAECWSVWRIYSNRRIWKSRLWAALKPQNVWGIEKSLRQVLSPQFIGPRLNTVQALSWKSWKEELKGQPVSQEMDYVPKKPHNVFGYRHIKHPTRPNWEARSNHHDGDEKRHPEDKNVFRTNPANEAIRTY